MGRALRPEPTLPANGQLGSGLLVAVVQSAWPHIQERASCATLGPAGMAHHQQHTVQPLLSAHTILHVHGGSTT